ncbi:nitroreductase family protein [Sandaracinus amylolyticus]|uniref:nitroreductase family protein n=1 Tax=Sandaracinus amylolyticus TaxID=927083 RepID=UPI001F41A99F|nr:nitroreductase family protein [Sandaracinus amylolyticus]UJR83985.1 Hypothetical protein I5071_60560 [Sandaracinus amylolyticus]
MPTLDSSFRVPEAAVDDLFVARRSHRALSPEPLPRETIESLFEAARWAPSANNGQPWLFVYADDEPGLARLRSVVIERNRRWADRAPVLVLLFARRFKDGTREPIRTHAFDAGAAWMSLALQAERLGLSARAMGGIHLDATYEVAGVSRDEHEIMCAIAIGRRGNVSALPADLAQREIPSARRPLREIAIRIGG